MVKDYMNYNSFCSLRADGRSREIALVHSASGVNKLTGRSCEKG